jgi:hypothetical protein
MSHWKAAWGIGAVVLAGIALASSQSGRSQEGGLTSRGEYLVTVGGCNDCHTPWKVGKTGHEPDLSRMLSGHPEQLEMPASPELPRGPWAVVVSGTFTAWSGPWGVSFSANLTPDEETGLGRWTEKQFIDTMRSGRHEGGRGRPILPPMPVQNFAKMTDADLKAVWAYLRSIPAMKNRVPEPLPPSRDVASPAGRTTTGMR